MSTLGRSGGGGRIGCNNFQYTGNTPARTAAFTLIEIVIGIGIIVVLASLILATSGYVIKKGQRSRAEAEIAALSAALENYKADNGTYPRSSETDSLDPSSTNPTSYQAASLKLYEFLSGDSNDDRTSDTKSYFAFKPNQLNPSDQTKSVTSLRDPFGNPYGYSTMKASDPTKNGFNPTFDLWSGADDTAGNQNKWIKNW